MKIIERLTAAEIQPRYCGELCSWSSTLQAKLQDGKWKVRIAPGAFVLVSQAGNDSPFRAPETTKHALSKPAM